MEMKDYIAAEQIVRVIRKCNSYLKDAEHPKAMRIHSIEEIEDLLPQRFKEFVESIRDDCYEKLLGI